MYLVTVDHFRSVTLPALHKVAPGTATHWRMRWQAAISTTAPDIYITYNNGFSWYFGKMDQLQRVSTILSAW